jgi:hypothetical protein
MSKSKLAILGLAAVSLLVVGGVASAGIVDPCLSTAEIIGGPPPCCLFICPGGGVPHTPSFCDQGWYVRVRVIDTAGFPIPGLPPADIWLIDCDPVNDLCLCGGSGSADADSVTDSSGYTTICDGTIRGGGCVSGLAVVAQGFTILDGPACTDETCLDVEVRSPDINGDCTVDLIDLSLFATGFPPSPYATCSDFDCDGLVNLIDLSSFAFHFGPPGDSCP